MAELKVNQVDCANCGSKIDIRTGLRAKTFTCEYCGAVCENDQVVAIQNQQEIKLKYAPMSFLKLGLRGTFLGQRYQIVGRIRLEGSEDGETWFWDEWFLMSASGYPLWLIEDEHGFSLLRVHVATEFIDPYTPSNTYYVDNSPYQIEERGYATLTFLEGELTWRARPKELVNYIDLKAGQSRFSIEYSDKEIQYLKGSTIPAQEVKEAFKEDLPPELAAINKAPPKPPKEGASHWIAIAIFMIIAGVVGVGVSFAAEGFGTKDFDEASARYLSIRGGSESEFEYGAVGGQHRTFTISSGPVVKFEFTSSHFPFPSYRTNQEIGWWLAATLFKLKDDGSSEKVTVINADFWRARGYEDGESWSESKMRDTTYLKGLEKGAKYYFTFAAGPFVRNGFSYRSDVRLRTRVVSGAWNPKPLRYFSFGAIALPILLLIILYAIRNHD